MRQEREKAHADLSKVDWGLSVSLDAERQLLGLLLARGDVFDQVGTGVAGRHFFEPLHRRIFDLVTSNRGKGLAFDRDRLQASLAADPAFKQLGGARYLDSVMQAASIAEVEGAAPTELAALVADLHVRREVIAACADISIDARGAGGVTGRELRDKLERRIFKADMHQETEQLERMGAIATRALASSQKKGADLLSTGFAKLDTRFGKCERGDFILLAARPSMGKSALASCWALNSGKAGLGAIEFNGEMSAEQIARRHLTDECYSLYDERAPSYRDVRQGKLDANQEAMLAQAQANLDALPIMAMRKRAMTLPFIRSAARRQMAEWAQAGIELGFLFIDSINNLDAGLTGFSSPVERMTVISAGLKTLAVDLNCVVVGLSQLSRKVEDRDDKRPQLADLRESGSLEQDADVVVGIYRDAYYAEREPKPKKDADRQEWLYRRASQDMEAITLKVKEGAPGTDKLFADVARNAVRDEQKFGTEKTAPGELDFSGQPGDEVPL